MKQRSLFILVQNGSQPCFTVTTYESYCSWNMSVQQLVQVNKMYKSFAAMVHCEEINWWPMYSTHKGSVMPKAFPCHHGTASNNQRLPSVIITTWDRPKSTLSVSAGHVGGDLRDNGRLYYCNTHNFVKYKTSLVTTLLPLIQWIKHILWRIKTHVHIILKIHDIF